MSLCYVLRANNSSGHQDLFIDRQDEGVSITLCGIYEGKEIQLDFETISDRDLDDLITFLSSRRVEKMNPGEIDPTMDWMSLLQS